MDKKGVSQIVTTILIILIVLAAIVIVWNVVKKTITEGAEDVTAEQFTVSLSTSQVDLSENLINVSVTRNAGAGDIIAIKIVFLDETNNSYIYENTTDIPSELETIIYPIPRSDILLTGTLTSFKVYPIIAVSENKNATGLPASGGGGGTTTPTTPPGCTPSTEVCDNKDNNCDGQIDEGLSRSCGSDIGECKKGTETCSAGTWGTCIGATGPTTEICDGLDNDCDGIADNVAGGCGGVCDTDSDGHDEFWWCLGGGPNDDCDDIDPSIYSGAPELCDGKDNQSSGDTGYGTIDEGCSCSGNPMTICNAYDGMKSTGVNTACLNAECSVYEKWCNGVDIDRSGSVGMGDYSILQINYNNGGCNYTIWATGEGAGSDWCGRSDITQDGSVGMGDYSILQIDYNNGGCNAPENITIDCYSTATCSGEVSKSTCQVVPGCSWS